MNTTTDTPGSRSTVATGTSASSRSWLTLVAMTGSLSMVMLDQTVVSVALPTMSRDLPLSATSAQWVINLYVLAMAVTVAIGGKLGSKLGPVTTFRFGVAMFLTASAACGLAPNSTAILAARAAQGIGAALMMPVSASIVMGAFPESRRGRAMGAYVGISQLFLALGPLVGGALTQWWSWRIVFWLNVPVGLLALLLVHIAKPANPRQRGLRISPPHTVLLIASLGASVYALQQSSQWHWESVRTLGVLGAGIAGLALFSRLQVRDHDPLVAVRLFGNRGFVGNSVVLFATQFGMLAMTLYASLYAQNLLGYSPIEAGFTALAMILPLMAAAQIAGRWYDRSGVRPPVLLGLALATLGAAVWALALPDLAYTSKIPGMALVGFGLGLVFSPINTDALSRVAPTERPQASGVVQTVRQLGGTVGVAIIGSVILAREHSHVLPSQRVENIAHAMTYGFWTAATVFAVGLVLSLWLLPRGQTPDFSAVRTTRPEVQRKPAKIS